MRATRRPAVAGLFYPADPRVLADQVYGFLETAAPAPSGESPPKALIVPHAGYPYSGAAAATAYRALAGVRHLVTRVVLVGPAHRIPLRGFAVPEARSFATPLGEVAVDMEALHALSCLPQVVVRETAHRDEHSLEVQLPFLQIALDSFQLVPLVSGDATLEEAAQVFEALWGGPETLVVVSTDLSHHLDDWTASKMDQETAAAIENLAPERIGQGQACGRVAVRGLLAAARRRQLRVQTTALTHSGKVTGDPDQVVGYGAFVLREPRGEPRSG